MTQAKTGDKVKVHYTASLTGDKTVTLDANHPLAGKELFLELELVAIA